MREYIFSSESVAEGHPDKVCDQISDAILDFYLSQDPQSRVAAETVVSSNYVGVFGEITSAAPVDPKNHEKIARKVIADIGYEQDDFHWETFKFHDYTRPQSQDISIGVDNEGAGDQGIMFGFATDETDVLMPAPLYYSHKILRDIHTARHCGKLVGLGPDAKSQVSLRYEGNQPVGVERLVLSTQHNEDLSQEDVRNLVLPYIMQALPDGWIRHQGDVFVNPTGRFVIGGPASDVGLTGRKIIVDSYGGSAPHGGGAFSGKDPSKVDRSAAYMMRYIAKNIVASGIARKCTLQISYAIGMKDPMSFYVNTHGTSEASYEVIERIIRQLVDLSPNGIIKQLNLKKPIYRRTSTYGHFGRMSTDDGGFSWEKLDLVESLKSLYKKVA